MQAVLRDPPSGRRPPGSGRRARRSLRARPCPRQTTGSAPGSRAPPTPRSSRASKRRRSYWPVDSRPTRSISIWLSRFTSRRTPAGVLGHRSTSPPRSLDPVQMRLGDIDSHANTHGRLPLATSSGSRIRAPRERAQATVRACCCCGDGDPCLLTVSDRDRATCGLPTPSARPAGSG